MYIALRPRHWGDALVRWALRALQQHAAARRQRRRARIVRASELSAHLRRDIGLGREWVE